MLLPGGKDGDTFEAKEVGSDVSLACLLLN